MTRRIGLALFALAALSLTLTFVTAAAAHPGHEHKILGTVTMAAADHVMMDDKDGKPVTVYITAETKVLKDKQPMKVEDIEAGMRVVVTAVSDEKDEKMLAKTIELGSAPTTN